MKKLIAKIVIFAAVFVVLFLGITKVFTAKFTDNNCQSYTAAELYEQKTNTIEVAIGGSSQAVFCINAMELYEQYGISAYATGSPNQSILCSLGWLRELNKTQDIKVAVLDVSQLYEDSREPYYRQTLDTMKLSMNKIDIVKQHLAESDEADSLLSYIFPIIKYHSRWESLEEQDFTFSTDDSPMYLGTRMADYVYSFSSYDEFMRDEDELDTVPVMREFQKNALVKYADYCEENNIQLILFKTPKEDWTETKDKETQELADELGLEYINLSSREWCDKMNINYHSDFKDPQHLNVRGADKVADVIGEYLSENFDLTDYRETNPKSDEYMETYHEERKEAYFLTNGDVTEYLNELSEDYLSTGDYDLLIELTDDSICSVWTDDMQEALESCGIKTDIRTLEGKAYAASIISGDKVKEAKSTESEMDYAGTFGNDLPFIATSIPDGNSVSRAKFIIDGVRKYMSSKGLNLFLYNNKTGEILDTPAVSVCSDGQLRLVRPIEDKHQ